MREVRAGPLEHVPVTGVNKALANVNPPGTRHADRAVEPSQDVSNQPSCRRFAVSAGNGDNRDPTIFAVGEQAGHNGLATRLDLVGSRLENTAKVGLRVHGQDSTADFFEWPADVLGDDLDSCDIEPDGPGCLGRSGGVCRMDLGHYVRYFVSVLMNRGNDSASRHQKSVH